VLLRFTFLLVDRYGFRKLEVIFAILIGTMAISFGYEFFLVKPEPVDLLIG
jgi:natural resistance-associated macrophage protein